MSPVKKKARPVKSKSSKAASPKKSAVQKLERIARSAPARKPKVPSFDPEVRVYPTPNILFEEAAPFVMQMAREAADARGRFVVALSGGSTPKGLFQQLTEEPYLS